MRTPKQNRYAKDSAYKEMIQANRFKMPFDPTMAEFESVFHVHTPIFEYSYQTNLFTGVFLKCRAKQKLWKGVEKVTDRDFLFSRAGGSYPVK
jgi:hypothetical protein